MINVKRDAAIARLRRVLRCLGQLAATELKAEIRFFELDAGLDRGLDFPAEGLVRESEMTARSRFAALRRLPARNGRHVGPELVRRPDLPDVDQIVPVLADVAFLDQDLGARVEYPHPVVVHHSVQGGSVVSVDKHDRLLHVRERQRAIPLLGDAELVFSRCGRGSQQNQQKRRSERFQLGFSPGCDGLVRVRTRGKPKCRLLPVPCRLYRLFHRIR